MIKKNTICIVLAILCLGLSGCTQNFNGATTIQEEYLVGGERVLVGGEMMLGANEEQKFKPEIKLEKWNGEENLIVKVADEVEDKATKNGDKTISKSKDGKKEFHFYTKTKEEIGSEKGGFEYELILKEKPDTNIFIWQLENWEDLNFYYQDKIKDGQAQKRADRDGTSLEEAKRIIMPENVIGSYAVYHKTKKDNQYMVGKLFHIYRPKITDKNGDWIWGILNVKDGELTITVDNNWLDNARYPVSVDPTFGSTDVGAVHDWSTGSYTTGAKYTSPVDANGTVTKMSWYTERYLADDVYKGTLYDTSGNLITNGVGGATLCPASAGWTDSTFSTPPSITASTEYLLTVTTASGDEMEYWYDNDTSYGIFDETGINYASPGSIDATDQGNWIDSMYATYEVSTPPASTEEPNQPIPIIIFQ